MHATKNGKVSIYKESEATQENYQKTKRYRQVAGNGTANNAFAPHYMQFVDEMKILLTDYEGKRIRVLDGALVMMIWKITAPSTWKI